MSGLSNVLTIVSAAVSGVPLPSIGGFLSGLRSASISLSSLVNPGS
jgi:hypothetical protein